MPFPKAIFWNPTLGRILSLFTRGSFAMMSAPTSSRWADPPVFAPVRENPNASFTMEGDRIHVKLTARTWGF
jgi:hypothetical protein